MQKLTIALLGGGVVGSEVARALLTQSDTLAARVGARLELSGVLVRDASRPRDGIPQELLSTDPEAVVAGADIVVELMGGIEPARTRILSALSSGASVVTANKALLAQHFPELITAADDTGVRIEYEAAVAGAIPIVRPLSVSLAGDRIQRVMGIVNGTTNYILDQMSKEGWDFDTALATAQELGFAEADPTADIEGHDAAAKAAIIASLAFQVPVSLDDVHVEGITGVSADMISTAADQGFTIKLLAICERVTGQDGEEAVSARVYPALVQDDHPLASVSGAFNAVFVEADAAQLARTLADTDASVINGNNALEAGLSPTEESILVEDGEGNPYSNFLAVRAGDETNEAIIALDDLLHSDEVKQYIEDTWSDGAVLPAF